MYTKETNRCDIDVHITHSGCALVIEPPTALKLLIHLPTRCILQNQKHPRGILEIVIEAQNIRMPVKTHKSVSVA